MEIAQRHGLEVNYKPVFLGRVFAETGGLPLAQRHPARQRYRLVELQRWRDRAACPSTSSRSTGPSTSTLADRFVIAIQASHARIPTRLPAPAFAAIWEEERNLADPLVLAELAEEAGSTSTPSWRWQGLDDRGALRAQPRERGRGDVFGSPAYVLDGEVFWGQDRLDCSTMR